MVNTENRADVEEVGRLLPISGVFSLAWAFMIAELEDLRREQPAMRTQSSLSKDDEDLFKQVYRRAIKARAFGLLIALSLLQVIVAVLVKIRFLSKEHHRSMRASMNQLVDGIAAHSRGDKIALVKTTDEKHAAEVIDHYNQLLVRLRTAYDNNNSILSYLLLHHSITMTTGQKMASAEIKVRRVEAQAQRETNLFKWKVTYIGAIISFGAFLKQVILSFIVFVGFYFLVDFVRSENAEKLTQQGRLLAAGGAAAIAFGLSGLRLLFNYKRMNKIHNDTSVRTHKAYLTAYEEKREVEEETWPLIVEAYKALTGTDIPAEALEGHRNRMKNLDAQIKQTTEKIEALTKKRTFRQTIRDFIDGALQGGDAASFA